MRLLKAVGLLSENTKGVGDQRKSPAKKREENVLCVFLIPRCCLGREELAQKSATGSHFHRALSVSYPDDWDLLRDCRLFLKVKCSQASQDPKFPVA